MPALPKKLSLYLIKLIIQLLFMAQGNNADNPNGRELSPNVKPIYCIIGIKFGGCRSGHLSNFNQRRHSLMKRELCIEAVA